MRFSAIVLGVFLVSLQSPAAAMDLDDPAHLCNFVDKTSVEAYRNYLDIEVSEGHLTSYQADVLMGQFIQEELRLKSQAYQPAPGTQG